MNSNGWKLNKAFEYFDHNNEAILELSSRLAGLAPDELKEALTTAVGVIYSDVSRCSDEQLLQTAFVITDDLYKTASTTPVWDEYVRLYLRTLCGVVFETVSKRNYVINYFVDNSFPDNQRVGGLFPEWFAACGLVYASPQVPIDGAQPGADWRSAALEAATKAFSDNAHLVFVDADATADSFTALIRPGEPGVVTIFREQAPVPGSTCLVRFPETARPS